MIKAQSGQIFILATIVLTLVMLNTILLIGKALTFSENSDYNIKVLDATNLAEAGIDKAVASLNKTAGTYTDNGVTEYNLGNGTFTIKINSKNSSTNTIEATGYIPSKSNPKVKRVITIDMSKGIGAEFKYGMQVGDGGITMGNSSILNGSIYSNGDIITTETVKIYGDAWVAGGTQTSADQNFDCSSNCQDFIFGKSVSGNVQYDVAQSFQPSTAAVINKVSLKLKKSTNNVSNTTVRIVSDNSGKPSKTTLASGTLNASLVSTSQYGFIDVTFTSNPTLNANTTYWILIDTCSNSTSACNNSPDYWYWWGDSNLGYNRGVAKWSPNWLANGTPTWNNPSPNLDLAFKTYMGGVVTKIKMGNSSKVTGNVHANTIDNLSITGDAYYQTIIGSTVSGTSFPNSEDPPPTSFPISDTNITDWVNLASSGIQYGTQDGCDMTFQSGKITGNLIVGNTGCTVTIKSPFYVTGNIHLRNNAKIKLDSSLGAASGVLIVDGQVTLDNGSDLVGSQTSGSYLMLVSTYNSKLHGEEAIDAGNTALSGIIYAPYGEVELANGAHFKEITAWKITTGTNALLEYETGLTGVFFSSGPTGAFSVIKGTYQVK